MTTVPGPAPPVPTPADEDGMALRRRLQEVEEKLRERDRVVQALTSRLEVAAETLDRLHRSGQDRGRHVSGFPREVVEQQSALVADMQRAVEQWEDMQAAASLGGVEMQLGELRELLERRFAELAQAQDAAPESAEEPPAEPAPSVEPDRSTVEDALPDEPFLFVPVDPPQALDLRQATTSALQDHAQRLDQFVDHLTARLQQAAARPAGEDWSGSPQQVARRLEEIDAELADAIRLADYELALTREMLARKEARLADRERELRKR